ncbi:unnamed protein product [Acanthoscelides obtectus]|uniref:Uncharacterized protein n=1 Tax=Acanthoscelides obtectus TaxID=200917 RepID=A0A9P0Q3H8_ACAOB|nr:unnamed protein product [Acanthoscelides obtectus]CAK1661162.1 hypothetical protein AOBTE_LOCUS22484 [Acanthoscelides obtectus]
MQTNSFRTHSEHFCKFLTRYPGICIQNLSKILAINNIHGNVRYTPTARTYLVT